MAIKLNYFYSLSDLANEMKINERTFRRNKSEIMGYLNEYYLFQTWKSGTTQMYIFTQQYEDVIPPYIHQRKTQINNKADSMKIYQEIIDKEIETNPIFTAYGMANNLHLTQQLPNKHSVSSARRYIKEILDRTQYASENVWAKEVWNQDRYRMEWVETTPEERDEYIAFINQEQTLKPEIIALENDLINGLVKYDYYLTRKNYLNRMFWDKVEKDWIKTGKPKIARKPKWCKGAF